MESLKCGSLVVVLFLIAGISTLLLAYSGVARAEKQPALTNEECVKCHAGPPADIAAAGGKHKGVGCTGCHVGHPPSVKKPIPKCSQCHTGNPHFQIKGCLSCHKNPHTPLNISFPTNVTNACLACHTQQIAQLRKNKSKHTALNCSRCHSVHRKVPQCTQCHKPHAAEMAAADCRNCHKAHMPKVVTYTDGIQSKECGSCHRKAFDILRDSKSKHKYFTCVFCHKERHKMIPRCLDCHSSFHQKAGLMPEFPVSPTSWHCSSCHNIAHYLNDWPAASGLYNDVAATQEEDQAFKTIDGALEKAETSTKEFTQVMQEEPCDIKKAEAVLADMLTTADIIMNDCKKFCSDRSFFDAYTCMYCRKASVAIVSDAARQMLDVASYYAKVGNKDKAKVMYRKVIATFMGDEYRSYVLEAEFWLEYLK